MRTIAWNVDSLEAREDFVRLFADELSTGVLCLRQPEPEPETSKVPAELLEARGYHHPIPGQKIQP